MSFLKAGTNVASVTRIGIEVGQQPGEVELAALVGLHLLERRVPAG